MSAYGSGNARSYKADFARCEISICRWNRSDYMLSLAYMKPMCEDNLECIIMYAVENAYLMNPAYSVESAIILQHYKQNPVLQKKCRDILAQYWEAGLYAEERERHFVIWKRYWRLSEKYPAGT